MSEFFVDKFNKQHRCAGCKAAKLKIGQRVYSLCEAHLNKAREQWRCWQEQRRADGKCISCDKHSFNGWLRCKTHTKLNRDKCKRWMAANKDYVAQRTKERREFWLRQGRCICATHTPLVGGFTRCTKCRSKRTTRSEGFTIEDVRIQCLEYRAARRQVRS